MNQAKKFQRDMVRIATTLGVTDIELRHLGRHYVLTGRSRGRLVRQILASSPSDWRAGKNIRASLRRQLAE